MIERYTSLCVYREKPITDGSIQKFFDPISDMDLDKLFDITQMRGVYGSRTSRLFLVNRTNVRLKEGLFYEVEWTVQSNTEYPNGLQKLIGCRITTAPTIIDINPDYEPMILKGDVEACFEYYKKLTNSEVYQHHIMLQLYFVK